jgi:crotonobetainyl-CoA:carnitine CoA-transferase CaiB-like acyl-CoA transferase
MRPFEGIKILDCTHVLAGPFAAYQLAVLGADVIRMDDPNEPDQSRESGADHALNKERMTPPSPHRKDQRSCRESPPSLESPTCPRSIRPSSTAC